MPSTSKKQHNFMAAVANNPTFAKKVGVPQSVGQDFNKADKGHKFSKGGNTMATKGVNPFAKFEKSGKDVEMKGMKEGSKKDMAMDKKQMMGMKKGGMAEGGMSDMEQDKSMMQKAVNKHEGRLHKGESMTKLAAGGYTKAADGCAVRGKTKGTQVKMNMGGKAC